VTPAERKQILAGLDRRLRQEGSKEVASGAKAYMKSDLAFYGVTAPKIRRAAADILRERPDIDRQDLIAIACAAYEEDNFDLRSGTIAIMQRKALLLEPRDLAPLIGMVKASSCWAHVDWLATKIFPPALAKMKEDARKKRIRTWARDPHLWVRRTALLVQHDQLSHGGGDFDLFTEIAVPMLEEKSFWIRKAIGWVLRAVSKKRPALVRAFVKAHGARMSGVTRREAVKYI
jgi:3-methyladenine DNA glycosylase AlkD